MTFWILVLLALDLIFQGVNTKAYTQSMYICILLQIYFNNFICCCKCLKSTEEVNCKNSWCVVGRRLPQIFVEFLTKLYSLAIHNKYYIHTLNMDAIYDRFESMGDENGGHDSKAVNVLSRGLYKWTPWPMEDNINDNWFKRLSKLWLNYILCCKEYK